MRKYKAFTLIELLVVIAVIALLLAIITPALSSAKKHAKRLLCISNLHSIQTACITYAGDNNDYMPTRDDKPGDFAGQPHSVIDKSRDPVMDDTFFKPYLSEMRNKVLFCPGALKKYRPPTGSYAITYITYQYWNYPLGNGYWVAKQPNLTKLTTAPGYTPVWGCLTAQSEPEDIPYLSHEMVDGPHVPKGMSTVRLAGDAEWVPWEEMGVWWHYSTKRYYWPDKNNSEPEEE